MKSILFIFLFSFLSQAQNSTNECSQGLLDLADWSDLPPAVVSCLEANPSFTNGLFVLCHPDRLQLSEEYLQYLKFQKEYEDVLAWYQSIPSKQQQTAVARFKLKLAKENWETLGQKNTIRAIKSRLEESFRNCLPR